MNFKKHKLIKSLLFAGSLLLLVGSCNVAKPAHGASVPSYAQKKLIVRLII